MSEKGRHFSFTMKPQLRSLRPYEPGLSVEALRRRIGDALPIVKLGSNEGPWGPLPGAEEAIKQSISRLNRYPDGAFYDLRSEIARIAGVDAKNIVLGNGADSILVNLSLAMLEPGDEVVFGWPSFITYPLSVRKVGAVPVQVPLDARYRYDLDAMLSAITDRTRAVYVCNPNNPTGTYVDRTRLSEFIEALPAHVLCVVDEAYHEYVTADDYPDSVSDMIINAGYENVMVLRTMSKIYGLAGLRVGWGVAPAEIVVGIDTVRGPFEMNALANEAALASLAQRELLKERVEANQLGRSLLYSTLGQLGLNPIEGVGNFLCVPLPKGLVGRAVASKLQDVGVIIRPLDMFGMADAIRITVGTQDELRVASAALSTVIPEMLAD